MSDLTEVDLVTERLAEFVSAPMPASEEVRRAARMTTTNIVSLVVGAASSAPCRIAFSAAQGASRPAQATVLGTSDRTAVTAAALVGGIAAHLEDYDDTHLQTVIHPGPPIVPAAIALGEYLDCTYGEVLDAVAVGVEVALRVGIGLGRAHFDRGWHITGTTGRLGAAASCARLLRADAVQTGNALGIAATEAAGLQAAFGTMTKSFHAGKAAFDGVEAALLACRGFTSSRRAVEGPRGLLPTSSDDPDARAVLRGLGDEWELSANAIKPYACGIVSHPVIDAGIELRRRGLTAESVTSITVRTNPVVLDVMGKANPRDGLESKFSVYHCFAVGLSHGRGGVEEFSDQAVAEPAVKRLREMVRVVLDPSVARDECYAEVVDADGTVWSHHVEHATASKDRPMTADQLSEKVLRLLVPTLGSPRAEKLAVSMLEGDPAMPIRELVASADPRGGQ